MQTLPQVPKQTDDDVRALINKYRINGDQNIVFTA